MVKNSGVSTYGHHKAKNWGCPDTVDTNGSSPMYSTLFIRMTGKSTVSELVCQRLVLSASWLSASWRVSELVCQTVVLSASWRVSQLVCQQVVLSASWRVSELVCQRVVLSDSWLSASWRHSFIHSYSFNVGLQVDITQLQTDREARKEDRIIYVCSS